MVGERQRPTSILSSVASPAKEDERHGFADEDVLRVMASGPGGLIGPVRAEATSAYESPSSLQPEPAAITMPRVKGEDSCVSRVKEQ